jgi:hypothetical protein
MNPCIPARAAIALLICLIQPFSSQAAAPAEEMSQAAKNLLRTLNTEQRSKAVIEFDNQERFNWDFVPRTRKGIPFKELDASQQDLGRALLRSGLSQQGYTKATNIIYVIEQVLRELENQSARRDSGLYYISIFGNPDRSPWGWRIEGHHLSLNFTINEKEVLAASPSFFGSNPAEVPQGPHKGLRVLAAEEDLARQLVMSLNEEQRKAAVISTSAPRDIITGNARKAKPLEPHGISSSQLTGSQQEVLRSLIKEYLFRFRTEIAEQDLEKIEKAGFDKIHFAWAGALEPRSGHYYRVQGPTFLMEYDNTQNQANHIHTAWRDFENDFGEDLLRKHYEEAPHPHP